MDNKKKERDEIVEALYALGREARAIRERLDELGQVWEAREVGVAISGIENAAIRISAMP